MSLKVSCIYLGLLYHDSWITDFSLLMDTDGYRIIYYMYIDRFCDIFTSYITNTNSNNNFSGVFTDQSSNIDLYLSMSVYR